LVDSAGLDRGGDGLKGGADQELELDVGGFAPSTPARKFVIEQGDEALPAGVATAEQIVIAAERFDEPKPGLVGVPGHPAQQGVRAQPDRSSPVGISREGVGEVVIDALSDALVRGVQTTTWAGIVVGDSVGRQVGFAAQAVDGEGVDSVRGGDRDRGGLEPGACRAVSIAGRRWAPSVRTPPDASTALA
jgi:hypothetical protein